MATSAMDLRRTVCDSHNDPVRGITRDECAICLQDALDAAKLEGVRLGLEAAETIMAEDSHRNLHYGLFADLLACIRDINPEAIAKEADRGE